MTEINEASVRAEVRAWLEANWNPDCGLVEWRHKLAEAGWGVPHWPSRWYGRDLPVGLVPVVEEEFKRIGAIGVAKVGIRTLAAATILAHGTDLQKEKFLLRILTGEDIWCQLFSEPGSGSDVAGAVTRAEFRGNQWVVNGQKVWTTSAHKAHWGLLLARTDWDQKKHQGLSYFILDMKQPGVTVQPLRQMNGHASFNQVFFTDAKVEPDAGRRQEVLAGWRKDIGELAKRSNVNVKLGGIGMTSFGFDFHERDVPPSSEELATAWHQYIEPCIEAFGANRRMFESNFPPDKQSCGYTELWNAFKRITTNASAGERTALYSGTAARVYRLAAP